MIISLLVAATVSVPLGRPQRVGRFVVIPLAVEEDSRCPVNARCIWAGRVVVSAIVKYGRRRAVRRFTLGEPAASGLVLDSVTPERVAGITQRPLSYRVHFALAAPTR